MTKYAVTIITLCLATQLTACNRTKDPENPAQPSQSSASSISAQSAEDPAKQRIKLAPASRPYVTVNVVQSQSVSPTVQAPAKVAFRSKALSTVGAVIEGRISKIFVQVGERVKAGTVLAIMESREAAQMRSDVARTAAELQRAQDQARRQAVMQQSGVGLEVERAEAEIQLREAQTEHDRSLQAVRMLGDGSDQTIKLLAPIDGVVLQIDSSVGAAVEAGTTLFKLGEPGALWVVADVFDTDLPRIESGAKAVIEINALPEPVAGFVAAIGADIQPELRRGAVYVEFNNPQLDLKPGMFARVSIEVAGVHRIVLPTTAVVIRDKKQTVVYVEVDEGQYELRNVQIGQAKNGQVPILSGLKDGERVVTSGALLLDSAASMLL